MVDSLEDLLLAWKVQLTSWAADGSLVSAARHALELQDDPPLLTELVSQWAAGDFSALPPIVLLPASSMSGAAGAYAISTGTIYLNQDWLQTATEDSVLAVLSEELGHHLDGLLNSSDTPGDEGELFAAPLSRDGAISEQERQVLIAQVDQSVLLVDGQELAVEQSALVVSTPIRQTSPGRTSGEVRNELAFAALKADGSVVTWGNSASVTDSSSVAGQLSSGVTQIFSTSYAFAALKADGSVFTWGGYLKGGGGESSNVASSLSSGVSNIFSTTTAFAALKADGTVVTWGNKLTGGDTNYGDLPSRLNGVVHIFSTHYAFAALRNLWATGSRKAVEFSNCLAFLDGAQRTHFDRLEPTFQPILGIFEVRNRPMGTRTQ